MQGGTHLGCGATCLPAAGAAGRAEREIGLRILFGDGCIFRLQSEGALGARRTLSPVTGVLLRRAAHGHALRRREGEGTATSYLFGAAYGAFARRAFE